MRITKVKTVTFPDGTRVEIPLNRGSPAAIGESQAIGPASQPFFLRVPRAEAEAQFFVDAKQRIFLPDSKIAPKRNIAVVIQGNVLKADIKACRIYRRVTEVVFKAENG